MNKRVLCFMLAGILTLGSGMSVLATSVGEVQKKQTETQDKLDKVNQSITTIEKKRKEVQAQLSNLNEDLVDTMLTLELLESDLEEKQKDIDAAQEEYERLKALEEEQYEAMKLRIQYLYENGETDYVALLLEAKSISDLLNKADFVQGVYDYDEAKLTEYQETKDMAAEQKAELEEEMAELEEVQEAQQAYKKELDKKISSAKSKAADFESELADAKAKAKEYTATIKEQTALIRQLEEEEKEKETSDSSEDTKETSGSQSTGSTGSSSSFSSNVSGSGLGAQIANYAVQFVGNPYVKGGTSLTNGADCSGFTWAVHKNFGITIPRVSRSQAVGGKEISISNVQPGDVIYYGDHVGIYIGGGKIVHASTPSAGIKISNYTYRLPITVRRYW